MRLWLQGSTHHWTGIDLRCREVSSRGLAATIRGEVCVPAVDCPPPGPLHEHVGHVHPEMGLRTRTALARAARTRGATTAHAAGLPPVTAAKALHLLGEQVSPLGPLGRDIVADWLDGALSRSEALALSGASEPEFTLAAYCATHDRLPEARDAVEGALSGGLGGGPTEDALEDTHSDVDELL